MYKRCIVDKHKWELLKPYFFFTVCLDCRTRSPVQWSQSGEAEKRPIECTSAGAGDRATWQRAGKTSRHCESRHWAENRVFITKGLFYRGGGILPWKFMIAYPSSSFLHQRNQIFFRFALHHFISWNYSSIFWFLCFIEFLHCAPALCLLFLLGTTPLPQEVIIPQ